MFFSFPFAIASSCTVSSEGYTTHHFMSKLLQVCINFGMFWAAARCRRMPLAMCQKRWRVVPSFSAFRRQWMGRAGNTLFSEFARYCPINTPIYPFNWLSMHFCFIDFCPYDRSLSSSFWRREQKHLPLTDDDKRLKERNLCEKSCCWNYVKGPLAPAWTSNGASFKTFIQHCLLIWRYVCVCSNNERHMSHMVCLALGYLRPFFGGQRMLACYTKACISSSDHVQGQLPKQWYVLIACFGFRGDAMGSAFWIIPFKSIQNPL